MFLPAAWLYLWNNERLKPIFKKVCYRNPTLISSKFSHGNQFKFPFVIKGVIFISYFICTRILCLYNSLFFLWELYLIDFIF